MQHTKVSNRSGGVCISVYSGDDTSKVVLFSPKVEVLHEGEKDHQACVSMAERFCRAMGGDYETTCTHH